MYACLPACRHDLLVCHLLASLMRSIAPRRKRIKVLIDQAASNPEQFSKLVGVQKKVGGFHCSVQTGAGVMRECCPQAPFGMRHCWRQFQQTNRISIEHPHTLVHTLLHPSPAICIATKAYPKLRFHLA